MCSQILLIVFISVIISSSASVSEVAYQNGCTVSLLNTILGALTATTNPDKNVCAYMSIPYASPPVGTLRFQPPQPASIWEEVLNATSQPNWCPQSDVPPEGIQVTEDCLYLNVYQPQNADPTGSLPVMIWFHGGGFTSGSSHPYTPAKLLAREDVILVVAHYRLGLLGFFSTGDDEVPGNNGLKDQALSIRWVHEHIHAFGGNPNNVTIFGESAGGASVIYQLISPLNKGLIHGVIAQSGTALSNLAIDRHPAESAKLMAKRLGCPVDNGSKEMVTCLRQVSWQEVIKTQSEYSGESLQNLKYPDASITPVIEPSSVSGTFITEEPAVLLKSGDIPDIPIMLGANKHDGSFILASIYLGWVGAQNLDKNADYMKHQLVPDILKFVNEPEADPANRVVASSVELAYLSAIGVNRSSWNESMPGLVDMMSVFAFKSPIQSTAEILSKRNRQVYLYSFEHHSNNSLWSVFLGEVADTLPINHGIAHLDDLMYMFDFPANFSAEDQSFSEIICDLWLNFARFGNPTPSEDKRFENWLQYNSFSEPYLKLNVTPTLRYGYRNSWRPNGFEWN